MSINKVSDYSVALIDKSDLGGYGYISEFIAHDYDPVSFFAKVGRRPVHRHDPASAWPGKGVCIETVPVGDVCYCDLLTYPNPHPVQEILIDGDATFIVETGLGNSGSVDLATYHPTHGPWYRWVLKEGFGNCPDHG